MNFTAIDVETANPDMASICQIGIVRFENGSVAHSWKSLVNPRDWFCGWNVDVHGITEETVANAPSYPELHDDLVRKVTNTVLVCHTHFDRIAVAAVFKKHGLPHPPITWLDSARVVRRTWNQFAKNGYGLRPVADHLGIEFRHHDAEEDARAAGMILIRAIHETGLSVEEWLDRVTKPITPRGPRDTVRIERDGNPEGPLFGEVMVFTGRLS